MGGGTDEVSTGHAAGGGPFHNISYLSSHSGHLCLECHLYSIRSMVNFASYKSGTGSENFSSSQEVAYSWKFLTQLCQPKLSFSWYDTNETCSMDRGPDGGWVITALNGCILTDPRGTRLSMSGFHLSKALRLVSQTSLTFSWVDGRGRGKLVQTLHVSSNHRTAPLYICMWHTPTFINVIHLLCIYMSLMMDLWLSKMLQSHLWIIITREKIKLYLKNKTISTLKINPVCSVKASCFLLGK